MAKAMYEVKKNDNNEWAVFNKEDDAQVTTATSRDDARSKKKDLEAAYLEALAETETVAEVTTDSPTNIDPVAEVEEDLDSQIDNLVEENATEEAPELEVAETAQTTKEKKPRQKKAKDEVAKVEIDDKDLVEVVTRENYHANMDRAKKIQQFYVDHYNETGGFPSHRYMRERFNVSFKALIRHRRTVMVKFLGLDPEKDTVETTSSLPRPSKKAEATE